MNQIWAVVLAAGIGSRFGGETKKQYFALADKPLWRYSVDAFMESDSIVGVVLVVPEDDFAAFVSSYDELFSSYDKELILAKGGACRAESCYCALDILPEDCTHVLVHDAARPLISQELIEDAITATVFHHAAVPALPLRDTIKRVIPTDYLPKLSVIQETVNRDELMAVQTPQGFDYSLLKGAMDIAMENGFETMDYEPLTDDAQIVEEYADCRVYCFEGDPENIKITTPADLDLAEFYLSKRR